MLSPVKMNTNTHRLEPLLNPASIAIVGASNNATRIGGMPIAHLTKFGYQGQIFPINPKYEEVFGKRCYPDIESLPQAPDLVVLAIGAGDVTAMLKRCQAPYPLAQPAVQAALAALAPQVLARTRDAVANARSERERLRRLLDDVTGVRCVYPSQGNFLLARFVDAQAAFDALLDAGVVVRDMRATPGLEDALRISIGTPEQNDRVLAAVARQRRVA